MFRKIAPGILAVVTAFTLSSCKNFFNVNDNPNVAQEVTPALLLPTAQLAIGSAVGVDLQINGSIWAQYWTQNYNASQYKNYEQYAPTSANYDRVWGLLYNNALEDLKQMDSLAGKANLTQYQAIAKLLQAYSFQVLTDGWGDVPFSEALKGDPESGGILSPRFDRQQDIYNGLFVLVDEGLALINEDDPNHPGTDDLIYGGDMNHWRKFAYTLKLKMYMRLSERSPSIAQAGVQSVYDAILADPNGDFMQFLPGGVAGTDDAQIDYLTTAGNQNPLYTEIVGLRNTQNLIASKASADSLNANADLRRTKFFNTTGVVNGIQAGDFNPPSGTPVTAPGAATGALAAAGSASAPVKFITTYESMLLQAEAVARGWVTDFYGRSEDSMFRAAVRNNFLSYGLTAANANTYLSSAYWGMYPGGGSTQQKIRHIITQKWFCMTGNQGFEAWTEFRRTGYPDFLRVSLSSRIGNTFPVRLLYPNSELNTNGNFPGIKAITERVYWDVN